MKRYLLTASVLLSLLSMAIGQPVIIPLPNTHFEFLNACLTSDGNVIVVESDKQPGIPETIYSKVNVNNVKQMVRSQHKGYRALNPTDDGDVLMFLSNQTSYNGVYLLDFEHDAIHLQHEFAGFKDYHISSFKRAEKNNALLLGSKSILNQHKFAFKYTGYGIDWAHYSGNSLPVHLPHFTGSNTAWSNTTIVDSGYWFSGNDTEKVNGLIYSHPHAVLYSPEGDVLHEILLTASNLGHSFFSFYNDNLGIIAATNNTLVTFDNQYEVNQIIDLPNSSRLIETKHKDYLLTGFQDTLLYIQRLDRNNLNFTDSMQFILSEIPVSVTPLTHPKSDAFALIVRYYRNGKGQNEVWLWQDGIYNPPPIPPTLDQSIRVYPNPSRNKISVTGLNKEFRDWRIVDNLGIIVSQGRLLQEDSEIINIEELTAGSYFLILDSDERREAVIIFKTP